MSLLKQRGRELERFDGLSLIYWYVTSHELVLEMQIVMSEYAAPNRPPLPPTRHHERMQQFRECQVKLTVNCIGKIMILNLQ